MTIGTVRAPLALLVELLWSYAAVAVFVAIFGRGSGPAPSMIGVTAAVASSFVLARALQETELADAQFRAIGVAASLIALFAILHTEYAAGTPPWDLGWARTLVTDPGASHANVVSATVAMTLVWMRGVARGQRPIDADGVLASGVGGIVPVAVAAGFAPDVHGPDVFGVLAIVYFVLVMGALALYQVPDPDRPVRIYAARWAAGAVVVLAAGALFTVVAAAIDPGGLGVLAPIGRPVARAVEIALLYTLGPPLALVGWLFSLIPWPHAQQNQLPRPTPTPIARPEERQDGVPGWARVLGWTFAGGVGALIVAATIAVLWFLFRRFAKPREQGGERRERVEVDSSLGDDIGALFDAIARRFRRSASTSRSDVAVRRLYHEMLARAADEGVERPPPATPLQFAPRLEAHFGSAVPSEISRAFVDSRYGAHEPGDRVVATLRDSWRQIDAARPKPP